MASTVRTEPPVPSIRRTSGRRSEWAIASACTTFSRIEASAAPPRTVKSSAVTTTSRPSIRARPKMKFAGEKSVKAPSAA